MGVDQGKFFGALFEVNVVLLFVWIVLNVHLFSRPRGKIFFVDFGYGISVIANGSLWFVVHNVVFDHRDKCGTAAGYCGTISCVSGNVFIQGYVFMFVVLTLNAYININYIFNGQRRASRGRTFKWGGHKFGKDDDGKVTVEVDDLPIFAGCTHALLPPNGPGGGDNQEKLSTTHYWSASLAVLLWAAVFGAMVGAIAASLFSVSRTAPVLGAVAISIVITCVWVNFAGLSKAARLVLPATVYTSFLHFDEAPTPNSNEPAAPRQSSVSNLRPFFSKIATAEKLISLGVLATTLTGIMPTIATDPNGREVFEKTMATIHTYGIAFGVVCMAVGASHRVVTFFRLAFPTSPTRPPVTQSQCDQNPAPPRLPLRCNPLPCTWVPDRLTIGYPEWAAGTAVDVFIFVLFTISIVTFGAYTLTRPGNTNRSHICVNYDSQVTCEGLDRDVVALGLDPWPCVWNNASVTPCTKPDCNTEHNAAEIIAEFWVLTLAIMVVATHQCSASEELPNNRTSGQTTWDDKTWFTDTSTMRPGCCNLGNPAYCKLCCATAASYDPETGIITTSCMDVLKPCECPLGADIQIAGHTKPAESTSRGLAQVGPKITEDEPKIGKRGPKTAAHSQEPTVFKRFQVTSI